MPCLFSLAGQLHHADCRRLYHCEFNVRRGVFLSIYGTYIFIYMCIYNSCLLIQLINLCLVQVEIHGIQARIFFFVSQDSPN